MCFVSLSCCKTQHLFSSRSWTAVCYTFCCKMFEFMSSIHCSLNDCGVARCPGSKGSNSPKLWFHRVHLRILPGNCIISELSFVKMFSYVQKSSIFSTAKHLAMLSIDHVRELSFGAQDLCSLELHRGFKRIPLFLDVIHCRERLWYITV